MSYLLNAADPPSAVHSASICQPVVIEAQIDQIGEIRLANAHHRVGSAPIDLDRAISFRHGATSENNVVDIPCDLPRVFGLQDPGIADAQELRWVEQVMQSDS